MRDYPHIKMSRYRFLRKRQKSIRRMKKALRTLRLGCALRLAFDGTFAFQDAALNADWAVKEMSSIIDKCIKEETR